MENLDQLRAQFGWYDDLLVIAENSVPVVKGIAEGPVRLVERL